MIANLEIIKTLLNLTTNEYDAFIEANIPYIDQSICDYCNNDFINVQLDYFSSSSISFDNTDNSINMDNISNYDYLAVNDTIRIYKSLRNNQMFTIDSISTNKIICNYIDSVTDESEGEGIYITKINFPNSLKLIVSKMMNYLIDELTDSKSGIKTEKIDDYSVTFVDNINGFPINIMHPLNQYRKPYKSDLFSYNGSVYL